MTTQPPTDEPLVTHNPRDTRLVALGLEPATIAQLDALIGRFGNTRSEVVTRLIGMAELAGRIGEALGPDPFGALR